MKTISYKNIEDTDDRKIKDDRIRKFPERLAYTIGRDTLVEFGEKCGLSEGVLRKYLKGDTLPTLDRLDAIAAGGNVKPEWLLFGGDQVNEPGGQYKLRARIDVVRLEDIIAMVEQGAARRKIHLAGDKYARIIALAYQYYDASEEPVELETMLQFIDLAK